MKKIIFVALALLITGTTFAEKKCCKDKASCSKEASSSTKACCKKGDAKTASADADAKSDATGATGATAASAPKACCKDGHKASCHKDAAATQQTGVKPANNTK
jgi:hypothetical protein